jgi:hypothetical protein
LGRRIEKKSQDKVIQLDFEAAAEPALLERVAPDNPRRV